MYDWKGREGTNGTESGAGWSWWDATLEYEICFVEDKLWSVESTDALWGSSLFDFVPGELKNTI